MTQCSKAFSRSKGRTVSIVFCQKDEGHEGDCRGERAQWNDEGQVPITEPPVWIQKERAFKARRKAKKS